MSPRGTRLGASSRVRRVDLTPAYRSRSNESLVAHDVWAGRLNDDHKEEAHPGAGRTQAGDRGSDAWRGHQRAAGSRQKGSADDFVPHPQTWVTYHTHGFTTCRSLMPTARC